MTNIREHLAINLKNLRAIGSCYYTCYQFLNNYLTEVRLGSAVIKTFLGFFAGGDLVIKQRPDRGNESLTA